MQILKRLTAASLAALWLVHGALVAQEAQAPAAAAASAAEAPPAAEAEFPPEQIEQLVAPIALYPDALLAQIMMASTYPLDIVQAARWQKNNEGLEGEALEKATADESWDPSVKSLLFFPNVLSYMSDNLDWTQDLGDAVLGQQDDVTDAVQRLRKEAQTAGTLQTTEQQRVETEDDTIIVQPADPEVVYVPTYNPSTVYGQTAPPATTYYPTTYTTPVVTTTSSSTTDSLVSFGVGAAVGGLLTAAIMWNNNDYDRIYYGGRGYYGRPGYWGGSNYWNGGWRRPAYVAPRNVKIDRSVNVGDVNIDRSRKAGKWEHNPERRGGVRYRNKEVKNRYANVNRERRIDRDAARGRDPNRTRAQLSYREREKLGDRQRPNAGDRNRPNLGDRDRPQRGDGKRPELKRPETREARRPEAKRPDAKRPQTKPATRNVKKPSSRDVKVKRPQNKAAQRPAPKAQRPATRDGGRASAFNKRSGSADRAASRRGATSRSGSRSRSGGSRSGGGRRG
jgi:hypothetical protein